MDNYKEVIAKYKDADLDSLTEEEYKELKAAELADMQSYVDAITESKVPEVMYRIGRPITDLKMMMETGVEAFGDKVLYHQIMPGDNHFTEFTYGGVRDDVRGLGTALLGLGLKGAHIGVIGANCYEWAESYFAVTGGVGVVVPLDKELSKEELTTLCDMGEIDAVVCCQDKFYKLFKEIKAEGKTGLKMIIGVNKEAHEDPENGLYSWNLLREEGKAKVAAGDRSYLDARVRASDLVSIIFTSGTTGVSKGVMLSHRNLMLDTMLVQSMFEARPKDICFSVLPMHHCYECTATFLSCVYSGATVAFSRGLKYIRKDILEVKPTIMLAVPAIIENFHNKIRRNVADKLTEKQMRAFEIMDREASRFKVKLPKKVTKDIEAVFGGRMHTLISGGAPIDGAILDSFCNIGFNAIQGYGLSECSPIVALNPAKRKFMKNASAGHLMPFTECKILDADSNGIGEICFRGPQIMMGYYKDPENTKAVIDEEGWFHTGDVGYLDRDNYVFITGRKKNVIIASNGKNVFPEELESYLLALPLVDECMVWGGELDPNSPFNGIHATVRLNKEELERKLGADYTPEQAEALIDAEVDKINDSMPRFKRIAHVIVREREFDKTTSMKIRRFVEDNKRA